MDEEEQLRIRRAIKRSSTPGPCSKGYKAWKEWKALRRPTLSSAIHQVPRDPTRNLPGLFSLKVEQNLQIFYHILRTQLVEGKIWEAIQTCHNMLTWAYEKAGKLLEPIAAGQHESYSTENQAREFREEVAGYWCLYAHTFIQISETEAFRSGMDSRVDEPSGGLAAINSMEESLWDQAIAVLLSCTSCPFVGNHAAITLSLARLRLRQRQRGLLRTFPTSSSGPLAQFQMKPKGTAMYYERSVSTAKHWLKNIKDAMEICGRGIERASPLPSSMNLQPTAEMVSGKELFGQDMFLDAKETTERVATIVSRVIVAAKRGTRKDSKGKNDSSTVCHPDVFCGILDLPAKLQETLRQHHDNEHKPSDIPYLFVDPSSARLIFMETNCMSRLQQSVEAFTPDSNLQLVCDPERLALDAKQPIGDGKQVFCMDGVVWDDCLFFQNMNGVFVDDGTARKCWHVREGSASYTVNFFTAGSYHAINVMEDEVDGFAAFPSEPLHREVSFPCPTCYCLLATKKDLSFHSERCEVPRKRKGEDTLASSWEDLSPPLYLLGMHNPRDKEKKYFDVECSCTNCCRHPQLYAGLTDLGLQACWRQPEDAQNEQTKTYCEALPNSLEVEVVSDTSDGEQADAIEGPSLEAPIGVQTKGKSAANPKSLDSTVIKPLSDQEPSKAVDGKNNRNGKAHPGTRKRKKSSQGKRPVNASLTGFFDVEAVGGENIESDDDSGEKRGGKASEAELGGDDVPRAKKITPTPSNIEVRHSDSFADVEYPCRTCRQTNFSSEEARDAHELRCSGASGCSNAMLLEEQWPSFPSLRTNRTSSLRSTANHFSKPIEECPTPGLPLQQKMENGRPVNGRRKSEGDATRTTRPVTKTKGKTRSKSCGRSGGRKGSDGQATGLSNAAIVK